MIDPYSRQRIRRGAASLVVGKAVTSIAGIGTFILLVQSLSVEQFAAYSILFALVHLVDAISGFGLPQVLSRYVPELLVGHHNRTLRRLIWNTVALRCLVLAATLALCYAFSSLLGPLIGLEGWEWALQAYLAVVLARVAALTIFSVLESMLYQAVAQFGFGATTVARFVLLALFASSGSLDLKAVIMIELFTDLAGLAIMLLGMGLSMPRGDGNDTATQSRTWLRTNKARVFDFAGKGYAQHLMILPYGGSINRLLVGGSLTSPEIALFGFGQSIADLMERYLPLKLFSGVIRPVLTARYTSNRRFADLQIAANLFFKVNATLICVAAVVIFGGGEDLLSSITRGKYVTGGVGLLLLMCALVLVYSLRHMLDHVCHAVERNGPLVWSNAVITLSVVPGLALLPVLGVYALPAANFVGVATGIAVLVWRLRRERFEYAVDLSGLIRLLSATAAALVCAEAARRYGIGWFGVVTIGLLAFGAAAVVLRPWTSTERGMLLALFRRK